MITLSNFFQVKYQTSFHFFRCGMINARPVECDDRILLRPVPFIMNIKPLNKSFRP
jgi:hypothetical protein